jgi:hypothetical protein
MKSGSAKPALPAILLLSCSAALGQPALSNAWLESGAWPSTSRWVYAAATNGPLANNLKAELVTETWSQASSTNLIPDVLLEDLPRGAFYFGFSWIRWWLSGSTVVLPGTVDSGARAWTNVYIQALTTTNEVTVHPSPSFSCTTNTTVHSWTEDGVACAVTNKVIGARKLTNLVDGIRFGVPETWAWDAREALLERGRNPPLRFFRQWIPYHYATTPADPWNIAQIKAATALAVPDHCDLGALSNDTYEAWWAINTNASAPPSWSVTGCLAWVGAPTNLLAYTPSRNLGGGHIGEGHVVTSRFVLPADGVYTTHSYLAAAQILSGTQGQAFAVVETNANVLPGYTTADYGYKWIPAALNACLLRPLAADATITVKALEGYGGSWASAKATCTNPVSGGFIDAWPGWGTQGHTDGGFYVARIQTGTISVARSPSTSYSNAVWDLYVRYDLMRVDSNVFDACGHPWAAEGWRYSGRYTGSVVAAWSAITAPWCDEPGVGLDTSRGFEIRDDEITEAAAVLRLDNTNGYRYR